MKLTTLILPGTALAGAALLLVPEQSTAYSLIGGSLSTNQRDVRVYNNFTDTAANNNTSDHPNFPGYVGAPLAIWKAAAEWGSVPRNGNGQGDGTAGNSTLGNGGANFDASWQGLATGTGTTDSNIHSELSGGSGGTLAFCETPISNGWRIRYYSTWTWADGPGGVGGGQIDLQSTATHEYGHALGLGHSGTSNATMWPSILSGTNSRSIQSDDINGIKAVYGTASASKPEITGITVDSGQLTITGQNFASSGNEVWFTQNTTGGNGVPKKVTGLTSTGGGTQIVVSVPSSAGPGDVLVKVNTGSTSGSTLSNAWGIDPGDGGGPGGGGDNPPSITAVNPTSILAVEPDGPFPMTLTGSDFTNVTKVTVDGVELSTFPPAWTIDNDGQITFTPPFPTHLGPTTVEVESSLGTDTIQYSVNVNLFEPKLELLNSDPSILVSALGLEVFVGSKPGDLVFLIGSTSLSPTILPGLVTLDIGANLTNYVLLGTKAVDGVTGYAQFNTPLNPSLPFGLQIFVQAAVFDSITLSLPLTSTNYQSGTKFF